MFDIPLFTYNGYVDLMEDGTQYKVSKWQLSDMKKYDGKYAVIGFDGSLRIYEDNGKELFNGSLLDSVDFAKKLAYSFETESGAFPKSEWFIKNDERKKTVKKFADEMIVMMPGHKEDIEAIAKNLLKSK